MLGLGRFPARCLCVVQALLSVLILSYANMLQTPPTLTSIVHNFHNVKGIGVTGYVDAGAIAVSLCVLGVQWRLSRPLALLGVRRRMAFLALFGMALGVCHWEITRKHPLRNLLPENERAAAQRGHFGNPAARSLRVRGYVATALAELATGRVQAEAEVFAEAICAPKALNLLPVLPISKRLVFLQVECLGSELLTAEVDGHQVMPYLCSLAEQSFVMEVDGKKVVASCNSDYEILNTRVAAHEVVYYEHLSYFPDSIIAALRQQGYATEAYCGSYGNYMNLRRTYPLMGFDKSYFRKELQAAGFQATGDFVGGTVHDRDLFSMMLRNGKRLSAPSLQFGITMTMHLPGEQPECEEFRNSPYKAFYSLCRYTDNALRDYIEQLPSDTTVILWGDHTPYWGDRSGRTPFLVHVTGKHLPSASKDLPILTRCEVSHYLRRLLGLAAVSPRGEVLTGGDRGE